MMGHGPPRMVLWSRLRIPDIAGISSKLSAFKSANNCLTIADQTTRGVHEISAALHLADQHIVKQVERPRMKRRIDRHHVADLTETTLSNRNSDGQTKNFNEPIEDLDHRRRW